MSYDKNQKQKYIEDIASLQKGLLDFIEKWPARRAEYDRAGLSADLTDEDLDNSIYAGTAVVEVKQTITASDELHETIMADPDIIAYRGQLETLAKRR